MRKYIIYIFLFIPFAGFSQDPFIDFSKIAEPCKPLAHLLELFCLQGTPQNQNPNDSVLILINHGYVLGFSLAHNQPAWAAYQVSKATRNVNYARPPFFVDDTRLPLANRIGSETFGEGYDLGHMVPNAAINEQYGKLSQMETFLMSNVAPQKAELNRGVWVKLEEEIRGDYFGDVDHVWVITGPIFPDSLTYLTRKNGTRVAIPESFFCILVRPNRYPFDSPGNAEYLAFIFPQEIARKQQLEPEFLVTINEIEAKTKLNFFPNFTKHYENRLENLKAEKLWR